MSTEAARFKALARWLLSLLPAGGAALAATVITALAAAPAQAQTAPKADEVIKLEAFVSTGSRFNNRTVVDSPVPIDVLSQADLQENGYTELAQTLSVAIPSLDFPRPSNTDGTDTIRPAAIRGLSPDQTLVLLNGKRYHTSALVNLNGSVGRGSAPVDLNSIPSFALLSAEVLRDGAAAQYGSDAIAGVINLPLRRDLGFRATSTVGQYYLRDGAIISGADATAEGKLKAIERAGGTRIDNPAEIGKVVASTLKK